MTSSKSPNNEPSSGSDSLDTEPFASPSRNWIEQHPVEISGQHSHSSAQTTDTATTANEAASASTRSPVPPVNAAIPAADREAAERAEILKRIAAFRNLQIKLRQDREKYYDQTLARARSLLSQPLKPRR